MNIGLVDADLIGRKSQRFPNLACMKISSYYKNRGENVVLLSDLKNISSYDKIFISKVFTDTKIDSEILSLPNVKYGGTGFFYDKAEPLPYDIEHSKPDYTLYHEYINNLIKDEMIKKNLLESEFSKLKKKYDHYFSYSIGFTTRHCFRKCSFCVNRNSDKVELHSPVEEFLDQSLPYICLLDDNLFGYHNWKGVFQSLIDTKKPFQYKQGLDERLLTEEKIDYILKSKYKGDLIFAFDNIEDYDLIENKLKLFRSKSKTIIPKFYVFTGFDRNDRYDQEFYKQDIIDMFKRIELLMKYKAVPYLMRHENYIKSPYKGVYIETCRWTNQINFYKKQSLNQFMVTSKFNHYKNLDLFKNDYPEFADEFFNMRYEEKNI